MSSWKPCDPLIAELRSAPSVEELNELIRDSLRLSRELDCPCPSTLHLIGALLIRLHSVLDHGIDEPQSTKPMLNDITTYLASVLERATASGDSKEWAALASIWTSLEQPRSSH